MSGFLRGESLNAADEKDWPVCLILTSRLSREYRAKTVLPHDELLQFSQFLLLVLDGRCNLSQSFRHGRTVDLRGRCRVSAALVILPRTQVLHDLKNQIASHVNKRHRITSHAYKLLNNCKSPPPPQKGDAERIKAKREGTWYASRALLTALCRSSSLPNNTLLRIGNECDWMLGSHFSLANTKLFANPFTTAVNLSKRLYLLRTSSRKGGTVLVESCVTRMTPSAFRFSSHCKKSVTADISLFVFNTWNIEIQSGQIIHQRLITIKGGREKLGCAHITTVLKYKVQSPNSVP